MPLTKQQELNPCRRLVPAVCLLTVKGIFITFEGIEGSGKTTQLKLVSEYLEKKGVDFVLTREPGGTPIGDKIRAILLDSGNSKMAPVAELLLYAAARNQHIAEVIGPALGKGRIVLCDRYADATEAYQGVARRIDPKIITAIHQIATDGLNPDLTLLFDCPARVGLNRARSRNERNKNAGSFDRFEREEMDFHERVREGYLSIAKAEPDRVRIIDAEKGIQENHRLIIKIIEDALLHYPIHP